MRSEPENTTARMRKKRHPKDMFVRRMTQLRLLRVDARQGLMRSLMTGEMLAKQQRKKRKRQRQERR